MNIYTAEGVSNPNAYKLVCLNSNGHGALYLSANHNAYYVAVDSHNKVQALSASEIANVSLYVGDRVCENMSYLHIAIHKIHMHIFNDP